MSSITGRNAFIGFGVALSVFAFAIPCQAVQLECGPLDAAFFFRIDIDTGTYYRSDMPEPYPNKVNITVDSFEYTVIAPSVSSYDGGPYQWDNNKTILYKISRSTGRYNSSFGDQESVGRCEVIVANPKF